MTPSETAPLISVRDVKMRYGPVEALRGVTFEVRRGERFALLGPNGAGKSTLVRMMTTLETSFVGEIWIDGHDVRKNALAVRKTIGVVFQTPSLDDDLLVDENLCLHAEMYGVPRSLATSRIDELASLLEIGDSRRRMVRALSGGMKRRVEIARALIHRPSLLFLDEPTLGLDAQTRARMWKHLSRLNEHEGLTVFFSTHYMNEAEAFASQAVVIDGGKIVERGTIADITRHHSASSFEEAYLHLTGSEPRDQR